MNSVNTPSNLFFDLDLYLISSTYTNNACPVSRMSCFRITRFSHSYSSRLFFSHSIICQSSRSPRNSTHTFRVFSCIPISKDLNSKHVLGLFSICHPREVILQSFFIFLIQIHHVLSSKSIVFILLIQVHFQSVHLARRSDFQVSSAQVSSLKLIIKKNLEYFPWTTIRSKRGLSQGPLEQKSRRVPLCHKAT